MGSVAEVDNILSSRKASIKIKRKYILPVHFTGNDIWLGNIGVEQRHDG